MKKTLAVIAALSMLAAPMVSFADTTTPTFADKTQQYVETNHGWVDYHTEARLYSPIVGRLLLGDEAPLVQQTNAYWYEIEVNGQDVYITTNPNYTHLVTQVVEPAWNVEADAVIATAKTQLGAPYYWGHQVPIGTASRVGFDCSNFVAWSYRTATGISFSGASQWQRYNLGTPVALSDIREGDVLFFATAGDPNGGGHVGIYEGNGMVIQCGGGWGKVTEEPLTTTWLGRNFVFARRVIQ